MAAALGHSARQNRPQGYGGWLGESCSSNLRARVRFVPSVLSRGQRRYHGRVIAVMSRSARWPVLGPLWRRLRLAGSAACTS